MSAEQLALDLAPLVTPEYAPELTIQERFDVWIEANDWVLVAVEQLISQWLAAGHQRVGVKQIWERVRWEYGTTTGDTFRANNNWTSRVARLVVERHPDWADAIETRALRAA